jgi:Leucine-rich repeat (LRR) protein/alpha-tubulin suppressor-like RCC1 family protein
MGNERPGSQEWFYGSFRSMFPKRDRGPALHDAGAKNTAPPPKPGSSRLVRSAHRPWQEASAFPGLRRVARFAGLALCLIALPGSLPAAVPPPLVISVAASGQNITLSWPTVEGQTYVVEAALDLTPPVSWVALAAGTSPVTFPVGPSRYYRVAVDGMVYSVNVVGYMTRLLPAGTSLVANPFSSADNSIGAVLPNCPEGSEFYKVRPDGSQDYSVFFGGMWDLPSLTLGPGEGAFLVNPSGPFQVVFVGEVPQGTLINPLPAGQSLKSSMAPVTGLLNFPAEEGDVINMWDATSQAFTGYSYSAGDWWDDFGDSWASPPGIRPGEGFLLFRSQAANWVQLFSVEGGGSGPTLPVILSQPQSRTNVVGTTATFSVVASGTEPLTYQWLFGGGPLTNATNATLILTSVQAAQAGGYSVVVSNGYGSVTSTVATLRVMLATGTPAIAAGTYFTVGLKADGAVLAVGDNGYGQCNVASWSNVVAVAAGGSHTVGLKADGTVLAVGDNTNGQCNVSGWSNVVAIAAGGLHTLGDHTVALIADGTVLVVGDNGYGQCNVSGWSNVVAIAAGWSHTVGLKADGTVLAVGYNPNPYSPCDVSGWSNVVAIAAGWSHTVGLKADGTMLAVGDNGSGQCDVSGWSNVVGVSAGRLHTAGLKADRSVLTVGWNGDGQGNVSGWSNVVTIAAGGYHTVGLKVDGSVLAVGNNDEGQCNMSGWFNVVSISAGRYHTLGLKADGTVLTGGDISYGQGNVSGWSNLVGIAAGWYHTVGLKADGTMLAVGYDLYNQCNVSGWSNAVAIAAGGSHTVGLKADGTMLAVGDNGSGQCDVSGWSNAVAAAAGGSHTVGLKADGTVLAVGDNSYGQCDVSSWSHVVGVAAGRFLTVGLKTDGTVLAAGSSGWGQNNVSGWFNVVAVAAGSDHTLGLKADGTVLAVGYNLNGQCDVSGLSDVVAIAAGATHTAGLKADGTVLAVGNNIYGLCTMGDFYLGARPVVSIHPPRRTGRKGEVARIYAVSGGTGPLRLQWRKNGVELSEAGRVSGTRDSTLTLSNLSLGDAGGYSVVVSNGSGMVTSAVAILTVADATPPTCVAAGQAGGNFYQLRLTFSEAIDPASATNAVNYTLFDAGNDLLQLTGITLAGNGSNVFLNLSPATPLQPGAQYSLAISGVRDLSLNPIAAGVTVAFTSWPLKQGYLRYDYFAGISGNLSPDTSLLVDPRYPDSPTATYYATAFDSRTVFQDDSHESYGAHLTGFFIPPVSGNYIFYLRSDDTSRLYLNPNSDNPAGKVVLLEEAGCCRSFSALASSPQALVAGQRYYIEALHREGGGGDYVQVAAKLATDPTAPDSLGPIPGAWLAVAADPATAPWVTILEGPTSQVAVVGANVTLSVVATGAPPLSYQWQKNGTNITAATNATLSINDVQTTDFGSYAVAVSNTFGSVTSQAAALVPPAPFVLSIQRSPDGSVQIVFPTQPGVAYRVQYFDTPYDPQVREFTSVTGVGSLVTFVDPSACCVPSRYYRVAVGATGNLYSLNMVGFVNVTLLPGYKSLYNPLSQGDNSINNVIPSVPDGSIITKGTEQADYIVGLGWLDDLTFDVSAMVLDPGTTFTFYNPSGANVALTFVGEYPFAAPLPPMIIAQPAGRTVAVGTNMSFGVTVIGSPPLAYQWLLGGGPLTNATNAALTLASVQAAQAGGYSVVVSNGYGMVTSVAASLTVVGSSLVAFPDPNLEAAVRAALSKPTGDITPGDMLSLTHLGAGELGITNLAGLEWAANLSWLYLFGNQATSVSPLTDLTNLTFLDLWNNRVADISPLAGMTGLIVLSLGGNGVTNVQALANCQQLVSLNLFDNRVTDATPLMGLTNLTSLDLWNNHVADISPLAGMTRLTSLSLGGNGVSNVEALANCQQLVSLNLFDNHVTDATPLVGLTNLTSLDLWNNRVADISPLARMTKLTSLSLGGNGVSNVEALANCQQLVSLNLFDNRVTDFTPLVGLTNLTSLDLWNNHVADISSLAGITRLTSLNLGGNGVTDVQSLAACWRLVSLFLNNNQVSDITPLASLTNLTELYLGENWIADISPLANMSVLSYVDLRWNFLDLRSGSAARDIIAACLARGVMMDYLEQSTAPKISRVADQAGFNSQTGAVIAFRIGDDATAASSLLVTASSSDTNLLPQAGLQLGGSGANRTLILTPAPGLAGTATVILTVSDGVESSSTSFSIRVNVPACVAPPSGLVAWWSGDGTANDLAGTNNGSLQNGASFAPGVVSQAFSFDGVDDNVYIPASGSLNVGLGNGLTIEAWINPSDLSKFNPIVEWNNGTGQWGLHFGSVAPGYINLGAGNLYASVEDSASGPTHIITAPGRTLTTNVFQHVALTYHKASGLAVLYCNGVVVAQTNLGTFTPRTTYDLYLGRRPSGDRLVSFAGLIDEAGLFDRPLTSNEIAAIYKAGSAGMCKGPAPPVITSQPQSQTVSQGSSVALSVAVSGTQPLAYQWQRNGVELPGEAGSSLTLSNVQVGQAGSYAVRVGNDLGWTTSSNALLQVLMAPSILTPPASLVVTQGGAARFSVVASGPGLAYQWLYNGSNILGATGGPVLEINPVLLSDVGQYSVIVSNAAGQTNSAAATLTVLAPPSITTQPLSLVVTQGQPAVFTVAASGSAPLSYQWRFGGRDLVGETGPTLTVPNQPGNAGYYSVRVSNPAGAEISLAASLAVLVPPVILQQPGDQTVIQGNSASFQVLAGGMEPLQYQWRFKGTDLPRATNATLLLTGVQGAQQGAYDVTVRNQVSLAVSLPASLTVLSPPSLTGQPVSTNVLPGSDVTLTVTATGTPPLAYQWRLNGVILAGETNSVLVLTNLQATNGGRFSAVIQNSAGAVESAPADVVVLVPLEQPADMFANRTLLTETVSHGVNGGMALEPGEPRHAGRIGGSSAWYTWRSAVPGIATFRTSGSTFDTVLGVYVGNSVSNLTAVASDDDRGGYLTSALQFNALANVDYQIAVDGVGAAEGTVILSWSLQVTATQVPVITNQPASLTVLRGADAVFNVGASGPGLSYQWFLDGLPISGVDGSTLRLTNVQDEAVGYYTVRVTNGDGLSAESVPAVLQIGPVGSVQAVSKVEEALLNLEGGGPPFVRAGPKDGGSAGLIIVRAGDIGAQTLANSSAHPSQETHCRAGFLQPQWLVLQAQSAGTLAFDTVGSEIETRLAVYPTASREDLPAPGNERCATNDAASRSFIEIVVQPGRFYWACVGGASGTGRIRLNWKLGQKPIFTNAPVSLAVLAGSSNIVLGAGLTVTPVPAPTYQWLWLGTNLIAGATNAALVLDEFEPEAAGAYSVIVSNAFGCYTNHVAQLRAKYRPSWQMMTIPNLPANAQFGRLYARATNETYLWVNQPPTGLESLPLASLWRWDGSAWLKLRSLPGYWGADVTGLGASDIFALANHVTNGGLVIQTTTGQTNWTDCRPALAGTNALQHIAGTSNNVHVTAGSNILRLIGTNWTGAYTNATGSVGPLTMLTPKLGYALGRGALLRWDGTNWQPGQAPPAAFEARELWGTGSNAASAALYAAGSESQDGIKVWQSATNEVPDACTSYVLCDSPGGTNVGTATDIWGTGTNDIYAIGEWAPVPGGCREGRVYHYDGVAWSRLTDFADMEPPTGLGGSGAEDVWVALRDGRLLRLQTDQAPLPPRILTLPQTNDLVAGASSVLTVKVAGTPPFTFQWFLGEATWLVQATNTSLELREVTPNRSGRYSVVVANRAGSVTQVVSTVRVHLPPRIASPPQSLTVVPGDTATFVVVAEGEALSYQWQFNGEDLPKATNATLVLAGLQAVDEGDYGVNVRSPWGFTSSPPAHLKIQPQLRMEVQMTLVGGEWRIRLGGQISPACVIESTTDLQHWTPVLTNATSQGPVQVLLNPPVSQPQCFYRAVPWTPWR